MDSKVVKIAAVAVVIVIAVAAIAVVAMGGGQGGKANIDAALEVYGNADKDYKIDNADLDIIKKIAAGDDDNYTLAKYPLADANYDSKVDQEDVNLVQKILNKESCTVYHVNYITTASTTDRYNPYVVDTKWPISKAIGNGAANSLIVYSILGIEDKIAAINYSASSPPDEVLYPKFHAMESLGTSTMYLTASKVTAAVAEDTSITAVITADNKGNLTSTASGRIDETGLEAQGLDVVRIKHAAVDADEFGSALLLLGFLFQADSSAQDAAAWVKEKYAELDKKLEKVPKVKAVATSSGSAVSTLFSDYADVAIKAGGVYMIPSNTSSSLKLAENPWLLNDEYQGDVIIQLRTGSGLGGSWYVKDGISLENLATQTNAYQDFKAYQNHKVFMTSGDIPVFARVFYSAHFMYPDQISQEYADQMHQAFVDKFLNKTYNVSELKFTYTFDEMITA